MSTYDTYSQRITSLPYKSSYTERDLMTNAFRLFDDGRISVYFAPCDYVNRGALVALVGITPGFQQMEIAYREARRAILDGAEPAEVMRRAKAQARFAGPMRANLYSMLDGIGLPSAIGVATSRELFGARADLLHSTSALRYPVFVDGKNYTGHRPVLMRTPMLVTMVDTLLAEELAQVPDALVVPLGDAAQSAVEHLVAKRTLDARRCLLGFPHPSGGNGHRVKHFNERREALATRVQAWRAA